LVANDVVRGAGPWVVRSARPWLVARRGWLLGPLRAIGWLVAATALAVVLAVQFVVRSAVIADLVWLVRTVGRPLALALGYATLVGLCAIFFVGLIVIGFACVGVSTRTVVATLEDPPRPMAMAIVIGGATVLMYIGIAAFTVCGWVAYHWTRAGLRSAAARGLPFLSVSSR
ncbi:MAG: hypothetical protein M3O80_00040, partial [Chloroflexota bacterium]|nr:hypothetical protein [Chloroflexota bacterium]